MSTNHCDNLEPIRSDQSAPHGDLITIVERHLRHQWRKPIPQHTRQAADAAISWIREQPQKPLILDSFCGTGMSTAWLAKAHPEALVIGIDKSADRLSKHVPGAGNYRLLRAECEPFWRCLVEAGLNLERHHIFYPNPWPKGSQLKRRVHGHPGFALLPQLGGVLELRTNWKIYAEEFALACQVAGINGTLNQFLPSPPVTLFERKYHDRRQALWRFEAPAVIL